MEFFKLSYLKTENGVKTRKKELSSSCLGHKLQGLCFVQAEVLVEIEIKPKSHNVGLSLKICFISFSRISRLSMHAIAG